MRGFILGVIVTLLVVFGGAYFYATTGHFDTRAVGNTPSTLERRTANKSVDAWVDGHAPKQANPFQPTMDNIMDGSMTYDKNCAFCHGSLKQPISPMRTKFYPSVPQLMTRHSRRSRRQSVLCDQVRHSHDRHARLGGRADRRRHLEDGRLPQELGADEGQLAASRSSCQLLAISS